MVAQNGEPTTWQQGISLSNSKPFFFNNCAYSHLTSAVQSLHENADRLGDLERSKVIASYNNVHVERYTGSSSQSHPSSFFYSLILTDLTSQAFGD